MREDMGVRLLLLIALVAIGLAACGSEEDAANEASDLAQRTERLADEAQRTGRELAEGQITAEEAREQLRHIEDRANEFKDEASDLPQGSELEQANDRIAEAARDLSDRADRPREAYQATQERLEEARRTLGDAADRLRDQVPEGAREELDRLQDELP